jgi:hypothetical protein
MKKLNKKTGYNTGYSSLRRNFLLGNSCVFANFGLRRKILADLSATNHSQTRWQQAEKNRENRK